MMLKAHRLAIAIAIAAPLAAAVAGETAAAPMNGAAIEAATPAATIDVRYRAGAAARAYRDYPYSWDYPAYSYWSYRPSYYGGYPAYWTYSPYWSYPGYYAYSWW
jgi:hypothetical protein